MELSRKNQFQWIFTYKCSVQCFQSDMLGHLAALWRPSFSLDHRLGQNSPARDSTASGKCSAAGLPQPPRLEGSTLSGGLGGGGIWQQIKRNLTNCDHLEVIYLGKLNYVTLTLQWRGQKE